MLFRSRVSQKVGAEADSSNFLLMHAMGPNVAGVIGSAVAAGVFISLFGDVAILEPHASIADIVGSVEPGAKAAIAQVVGALHP